MSPSAPRRTRSAAPPVAFAFPGVGTQWRGMASELMESEPVFRETLDRFAGLAASFGAPSLFHMLDTLGVSHPLDDTAWGNLPSVAVQIGLIHLFESWGIRPAAVIGQSSGETAAAYAAGCLTLKEAARLAAGHHFFMAALRGAGGMYSVSAPARAVAGLLAKETSRVALCGDYSPKASAVAGPMDELEEFAGKLERLRIRSVKVPSNAPFHHGQLNGPCLHVLSERLEGLSSVPSRIPFFSCSEGGRWNAPTDAAYWERHASIPVRFREAAVSLFESFRPVVVELGPNPSLRLFLAECAEEAGQSDAVVLSTLRAGKPVLDELLRAAAQLAAQGFSVNIPWRDEKRRLEFERARKKSEADRSNVKHARRRLRQLPKRARRARLLELVRSFAKEASEGAVELGTDSKTPLWNAGLDSNASLKLRGLLSRHLDHPFPATLVFNHPTLGELVDRIEADLFGGEEAGGNAQIVSAAGRTGPLAVVSMACRFPGGAVSPEIFWKNLIQGVDCVAPAPSWRTLGDHPGAYLDPAYDLRRFDAPFFGLSPAEAKTLDPQQRMLLETIWELWERAGIDPETLRNTDTGVFLGLATSDFQAENLYGVSDGEIDLYAATGGAFSTAAGRISHHFGLRGPTMTIDTACSSSLVAVHQACAAIRAGECAQAVAAGANALLSRKLFTALARLRVLSPTGRCRTFDRDADGYVRGEGCGAVLIKPLETALKDGDPVLGLIRASAVNHDGQSLSLTAPSGAAQVRLMRTALARGEVDPLGVAFLETHGTGTALGDPVEVGSIADAYGAGRKMDSPLLLGAVKSQIGHLEAAAGAAGLIKTLLALGHAEIPPNLHLQNPNPHIPWETTPVAAPVKAQKLEPSAYPLLGAVSSFGFSGTNAHVILESPPKACEKEEPSAPLLLCVSARSASALKTLCRGWAEALTPENASSLASVSRGGRRHFRHRLAIAAGDAKTLLKALERAGIGETAPEIFSGEALDGETSLVLAFPQRLSGFAVGEGVSAFPEFREAFARAAAAFEEGAGQKSETPLQLGFASAYAFGEGLSRRGVLISTLAGEGEGLAVAAALAGALTLKDAARVASALSRGDKEHLPEFLETLSFSSPELPLALASSGYALGLAELEKSWCWAAESSENAAEAFGKTLLWQALEAAQSEPEMLLARCYVSGVQLDWTAFAPSRRKAAHLAPTYPFERTPHWPEPRPRNQAGPDSATVERLLTLQLEQFKSLAEEQLKTFASLSADTVITPKVKAESFTYAPSSAQRRLLFLGLLEGGDAPYHLPMAWRVKGGLNLEKLEDALQKLVARHEALRTGFATVPELSARVHPEAHFSLVRREQITEERIDEVVGSAMAPYDLASPPLMRVVAAPLGNDEHLIVWDLHHLVADGISMTVLAKELALLYGEKPLGPPPAPLSALAVEEAAYEKSALFKEDEAYWKAKIAGQTPAELPSDKPRPPVKTFAGRMFRRHLPPATSEAVRAFAKSRRTTPFSVLLAAFHILTHKLTGGASVPVGAPMAARPGERFNNTVGMCTNTVLFSIDLNPGVTVDEVVAKTKSDVAATMGRSFYPFLAMAAQAPGRGNLSRNPLFDISFVYERVTERSFNLGSAECREVPVTTPTAMYDFVVQCFDGSDGIETLFEYSTDLFDDATAARFADGYCIILEQMLQNGQETVAALDAATPEERRAILDQGRGPVTEPPPSLLARFESVVKEKPHATALRHRGESWTFRELDLAANRLANALLPHFKRQPGTTPIVGLCCARTPASVAAAWGILKAGAAYVMLNPALPAARRGFMARECRCSVIVDHQGAANDLKGEGFAVLDALSAGGTDEPPEVLDNSGLAYVLFTSGSTGRPKGCVIDRKALENYVDYAVRTYFAGRGLKAIPLYTSLDFDLTVTTLLAAPVAGLTLDIYDEDMDVDAVLTEIFSPATEIDAVKITPAHISVLDHLQIKSTNVAVAVVGGEAFTPAQVRTLLKLNPKMRLYNEYGPTEATVGCIVEEVKPGRLVRIGRPIDNMEAYVLDAAGKPAPYSVSGELWLGGAGLAQGYLGQPELTAERFVTLTLEDGPRRLYKTGDLARLLPDGTFDYLGRNDDQVKVRGHRVELDEVRLQLETHPEVFEAAVTAQTIAGQTELAAYVRAAPALTLRQLRDFLAALLPHYMVPAHLVKVDRIPLTPNGKVDRKALPEPVAAEPEKFQWCELNSDVERAVAAAWSRVLGISSIGPDQNFFALGGDSIKAIRIAAALSEGGFSLRMRDLFLAPTVAELAHLLSGPAHLPPLPELQASKGLSPIQLAFFEEREENFAHYNQGAELIFKGAVESNRVKAAFQAVALAHPQLRSRFTRDENGSWARVPAEVEPIFLESGWDGSEAEDSRLKLLLHSQLDPEKGLLWGGLLLRNGLETRLLLAAHHLMVDALSWPPLLDTFSTALSFPDRPLGIPEADPFGQWVAALSAHLESGALDSGKSHWDELARNAPPPLWSKAAHSTYGDSATVEISLGENLLPPLSGPEAASATRPEEMALAAVALALAEVTGKKGILAAVEGHGRSSPVPLPVESTVGWFTTIHPVTLKIGSKEPREVVRETRDALRRAPHAGFSYGALRWLGRNPPEPVRKADLLFNFLGNIDQPSQGDLFEVRLSTGQEGVGSRHPLACPLEAEVWLTGKGAAMRLTASKEVMDGDQLSCFAGLVAKKLGEVAGCCRENPAEATPADFTHSDLTLEEFDGLFS